MRGGRGQGLAAGEVAAEPATNAQAVDEVSARGPRERSEKGDLQAVDAQSHSGQLRQCAHGRRRSASAGHQIHPDKRSADPAVRETPTEGDRVVGLYDEFGNVHLNEPNRQRAASPSMRTPAVRLPERGLRPHHHRPAA